MNYSTYRASLDIHASGSQAVLHAKKGETKRRILITLTERGKPYLISSDCTAVFTATKPDGNIIYNDCAIDNNIICYNFTEQTTAAEGKLDCEIRLYGADNALIISPGFDLIVDAAVYEDGDVIESGTEVSALTALVSETTTLINTVNTKLENGEFNGPKGDTGATGPAGADGAPGPDGKSAYQYAQEGGYTGTEAAFAAKLAAEKLANPYALSFTGAVAGSYDGSEPLTVEIPGGGGEETELPIIQEYTIEGDETASIVFTGLPNISEFLLKIAWSWQSNSYSGVVRVSFHETLSGYNHRVGRITGVSTGSTEEIIIKGRPIAKNGEIVVLSAVATASRDVNESLSVSALTSTSVISVWWADSGKYFPAGTTVSLRGK